jgi:hypothetical protein
MALPFRRTPDAIFDSMLQRQEQCYSLLNGYSTSDHDDGKASLSTNVVQSMGNSSVSNPSRFVSSAPYSVQQFQGLSMFGGPLGGNYPVPSIEQQILPTVIESRRLSAGLDFDGDLGRTNPMDHGNTGFFIPRNNFAQRRTEAECKAQGAEGGDIPPQRDNLYQGEFHV